MSLEKLSGVTNSLPFAIFLIFAGLWTLIFWQEEIWRLLLGMWIFGFGVFRIYKNRKNNTKNPKQPIDYLNERYAKGEISKTEYEQIKHDLEFNP
ncbi:MAG: SHOCT domain-containing protein [Candidatus Nitrosopumilus sp. bin_68KS]